MATTTPNFGWPVPTSTDLVKDGATAIEGLGDAIDASLLDLKGGTTGQVLAKASNTDMDFSWVAQDDSNAIQNAIVDAKGDLIAASANDTPARLAVGSNGETLVADSSTSTGLRYQGNFAAGKNKIINGNFYFNQRAFTSTSTSGAYGFDRFTWTGAGSGTQSYSAQTFTAGTAPVAGYESPNFARITTSSQNATDSRVDFDTSIEDVRSFAGETTTISFWAKAASGTPKVSVEIVQVFGSGGSPSAFNPVYVAQVTLSTSWARYSVTTTVPSLSGKTVGTTTPGYLGLNLWVSAGSTYNSRTGSLGVQNNTFDFWGVQWEAGSVATAFQTATGTIQGELSACKRYLPSILVGAGNSLTGYATATTNSYVCAQFDVQARVAPTGLIVGGSSYTLFAGGGGSGTPTAIAFDSAGVNSSLIQVTTTAGSPTLAANNAVALRSTASGSQILFTGCEL
jgi:hypothetical protein